MNRPRTGGFQDQARLGLFCLASRGLSGLWRLWFSVMGNHGRPLCFHRLFLILESSQFH
jgi:hypothetical protein